MSFNDSPLTRQSDVITWKTRLGVHLAVMIASICTRLLLMSLTESGPLLCIRPVIRIRNNDNRCRKSHDVMSLRGTWTRIYSTWKLSSSSDSGWYQGFHTEFSLNMVIDVLFLPQTIHCKPNSRRARSSPFSFHPLIHYTAGISC